MGVEETLKNVIKDEEEQTSDKNDDAKNIDAVDVSFSPPVYKQRYQTVIDLLRKYKSEKFLDIGCAEGKLISLVKTSCPSLQEIVGIDIEGQLLKANEMRLRPRVSDFIFKRPKPLKLSFYEGSVTKPDRRLIGFDFIAAVEVIEHLQLHQVPAFSQAILGVFKPRIAVVTTPNADFNQVFPDLKGFRHPDHKFEWTRKEFQEWAESVACRYGYEVTFEGIGEGPAGTGHLGCCSQMALFVNNETAKQDELVFDEIEGICQYQLIAEQFYPYDDDERPTEQKLKEEIDFLVRSVFSGADDDAEVSCKDGVYTISLDKIFRFSRISALCHDVESLRKYMESLYDITNDGQSVIIPHVPGLHDKDRPDSESDTESEEIENVNTDQTKNNLSFSTLSEEECWD